MSPRRTGKTGNLKTDLVIIGGGGAGLAAAVAAAEKNIKVIMMEKRRNTGGNAVYVFGIFAADSPVQKRAAIEFHRDSLFKLVMNWAQWKIDARIVRAFIDKSGDTIRWLEEKGLKFDLVPLYPNQSPLTWHVSKGYGAGIMKVLAGECRKLGVELLTNTSATKILRGPEGNTTGIVAEGNDGEFKITARSVLIATGGYGGNEELLKKYCPQYRENMKCLGIPNTGDGLKMAVETGAATEGLGMLMMAGPQVPESISMKIGAQPDVKTVPLMAIVLEPDTLWINKRGERFVDESTSYNHFVSANAINRQPENVCYTLFDSELVEKMTRQGLIIGMGPHTPDERAGMPGLERELGLLAEKGWVKISGSWDGIADWIGADSAVLNAMVEEYNTSCDRGYDPVFAKERVFLEPLRTAPYYAIKGNSNLLDTVGGIKINHRMEVLDMQGDPIPGLYAAGVAAGGWEIDTHCASLSGAPCGFAINSGRIAAEKAIDFMSACTR